MASLYIVCDRINQIEIVMFDELRLAIAWVTKLVNRSTADIVIYNEIVQLRIRPSRIF